MHVTVTEAVQWIIGAFSAGVAVGALGMFTIVSRTVSRDK